MYLEGSILFSTGAAFSMNTALFENRGSLENALVTGPYLVGGMCFTIGSYLGLVEATNAPINWLSPRKLRGVVSWKAVAGYGAYTIGALFFNVNTFSAFFQMTEFEEKLFVWVAAICGSLGFVLGSLLECHTNKVWQFKPTSCAWWLCVANLFGSACFLIAGISGFCQVDAMLTECNFTYLIGSAGFMVGALCTLWLWKCEQYGLGFIP
eukprot:CAMPEP_0180713578 /NCGR_PEP_ID=MMETSP1038_2-20121128/11976_1 /TAXON_ID=632150 /ORGANISM="Azadinium spinosum, Strain 3D9" /LENGTH=208 /DNA_ID=CAMNT_0022745911 /DNA_START=40 /DNA_END=663 /DNA_ORIENTATION=-